MMDMNFSNDNTSYKRVLGSMLSQHIGESVCLLGSLIQLEPSGRMLKMKTSDDQVVNVQLPQPPIDPIEGILQVHGTVTANNTIQCSRYIPFAQEMTANFDMKLYSDVVEVMWKYPGRYTVMA